MQSYVEKRTSSKELEDVKNFATIGTFSVPAPLTQLPAAFYDFLSYEGGGGDFYPTPQKTMSKLFDWFEISYT